MTWFRADVALLEVDTWHCAEGQVRVAREKKAGGTGTLGGA